MNPRRPTVMRQAVAAMALVTLFAPHIAAAQTRGRPALSTSHVNDIARLVMLEDQRLFDADELARLLSSDHPEVRRRAAISVARINDKRGVALLRARPLDGDSAVAATTVFAVGQLRDTTTIPWFDSLLTNTETAPTVATEAAIALGKIKTGAARAVLARFLASAQELPRTASAIGEALLAIGRVTTRGDIAPILRWTQSANGEVRWRATWALFRARDPQAVPALLGLSDDPNSNVRTWAVRSLTRAQAESASMADKAEAKLIVAIGDPDRGVRTEAVRTLGTYSDSASMTALLFALESSDSWMSVSAAEGLGRMRDAKATPRLVAATGSKKPCALRITAMQALQAYAPALAVTAAIEVARDPVSYCQQVALQTLARDTTGTASRSSAAGTVVASFKTAKVLTVRAQAWQTYFALFDAGKDGSSRRAGRLAELTSTDDVVRAAAWRSMSGWADSTDLPVLFDAYNHAQDNASTQTASATVAVIGAIQRRQNTGAAQFFARFQPPSSALLRRDVDRAFGALARQKWPEAPKNTRTLADYQKIVERWVVPDYNGLARPQARWQTPRGIIDLELYPGDAPLAVDDFVRTMNAGTIVGTEFTRVVPDFVDQQRTIRDGNTLRDEVNRHGLTRGNLAWATAGLDTGSPGYTLGHTPQPHNEGDFTSLGRVIRGMDAVDHIELGDRIVAARMLQVRLK